MSADNGIYIGRFLAKNPSKDMKYEYRVCYAQAIENCDHTDDFPKELSDAAIVSYYGKSPVFHVALLANEYAHKLHSQHDWTEYGVCGINYDILFPTYTQEEADKIHDDYFENLQKQKDLAEKALNENIEVQQINKELQKIQKKMKPLREKEIELLDKWNKIRKEINEQHGLKW